MRGIAFYFFSAAALCVTGGMLWGIEMSISGDHSLMGAHAHLNLVGWVTMGLFGIYYAVTPTAAGSRLATIHFGVALAGVVLMVAGIVMALREAGDAVVAIGSILTALSMLIFLFTVFINGIGMDRESAQSKPATMIRQGLAH
jgi:hypothetical protein